MNKPSFQSADTTKAARPEVEKICTYSPKNWPHHRSKGLSENNITGFHARETPTNKAAVSGNSQIREFHKPINFYF